MLNRFKEWCAKERVGRFEEGTSQDMCPTNGELLFFKFIMTLVGLLVAAAIWFKYA